MNTARLLQAIKKRPWSSTGVVGISGLVGTAALIEYHADWQEERQQRRRHAHHDDESGSISCSLPRTYNRDAIRRYWMQRPISITYRLGQVLYELSPLGLSYMNDFVLKKSRNNNNNSQMTTTDDLEEEELQLQQLQIHHAKQLRQALTNLGPAWVKGGQQLSIRPDLIPPAAIKELQKLCDAVKPISNDIALDLIKKELSINNLNDLFDNIQLVASASIGQVYKATIRSTGEEVAIKVQRPGMRRCFSRDLFLLQMYGDFVDTLTSIFTNQAPFHKALFDHFAQGSYSELDYEQEAANQRHFKLELSKRQVDRVYVPIVYDNFTTEKVLTTQWIDGIPLASSSTETIRELIPVGVELFLTQLLDIGAFHADPHPGNLLVTTKTNHDGKQQQVLCLLDFGLCAIVDEPARKSMTQAILNLLARDFDALVHYDSKNLGFLPHDFDTTELKPILTKVLTGGVLESGSNMKLRKRKLMEISNELNEIFFLYPFQVPPFFALVTRGLGLLEGIALTGDPEFDLFRASAPYVTKRAVSILGERVRRATTSRGKDGIGKYYV